MLVFGLTPVFALNRWFSILTGPRGDRRIQVWGIRSTGMPAEDCGRCSRKRRIFERVCRDGFALRVTLLIWVVKVQSCEKITPSIFTSLTTGKGTSGGTKSLFSGFSLSIFDLTELIVIFISEHCELSRSKVISGNCLVGTLS